MELASPWWCVEMASPGVHAANSANLLEVCGVRPRLGGVRSWPPQILEVRGVRPILEVCGVRLTPVVCGVGLPRSWSSDDRVIVSVPWPVAWLLYQLSRLPLLDARAACDARVVRIKIGFRV